MSWLASSDGAGSYTCVDQSSVGQAMLPQDRSDLSHRAWQPLSWSVRAPACLDGTEAFLSPAAWEWEKTRAVVDHGGSPRVELDWKTQKATHTPSRLQKNALFDGAFDSQGSLADLRTISSETFGRFRMSNPIAISPAARHTQTGFNLRRSYA